LLPVEWTSGTLPPRAVAVGLPRILEAVEAAGIPGGGPTLSTGVQAIMALDEAGAFKTR